MNSINLNENETVFKRVAFLNIGEGFGELALIDSRRGKRAARIICTQKSSLAAINAEDYHMQLAKIEKKKRLKIIDFFKQTPYFKSMNNTQINKLINSMQQLKFKRGQTVIKEGPFNTEFHESEINIESNLYS